MEKLERLKKEQKILQADLRQAEHLGNYGVFGDSWGRLAGESQDSIRQKLKNVDAQIEIMEQMPTHQVLVEFRKGGADIPFKGTRDECIKFCEAKETPEEFNDPENGFYGSEEESYQIVKI